MRHHGKSRSFLWALKSNAATAANKASPKTPKRTAPGSANLGQSTNGSKGKSPSLTIRYLNLLAVWNMKCLFHVHPEHRMHYITGCGTFVSHAHCCLIVLILISAYGSSYAVSPNTWQTATATLQVFPSSNFLTLNKMSFYASLPKLAERLAASMLQFVTSFSFLLLLSWARSSVTFCQD